MIAVNIALLPPDEVVDEAVAINQQLLAQQRSPVVLHKTDCLPHITLIQTGLRQADLPAAQAALGEVAAAFDPLLLSAQLVAEDRLSYFAIKPSAQLQELHEAIMKRFAPLVSYEVAVADFADPEISEQTLSYVRNFDRRSAYEQFDPHITLGVGRLTSADREISFTASRLAICQLGSFNTCKKILHEIALRP